jgi:hypothetical protein
VKEISHDLSHDLTFYCTHNHLCVSQYKVNTLGMYNFGTTPKLSFVSEVRINQFYLLKDQSMKFSWNNIENWQSWKMRFFWVGHFEFFFSKFFFSCFISMKTSSRFIWGIIYFCTMDGFLLQNLEKDFTWTNMHTTVPKVIIHVQSGIGVFNRLVLCLKCMELACWELQTSFDLYYYSRYVKMKMKNIAF